MFHRLAEIERRAKKRPMYQARTKVRWTVASSKAIRRRTKWSLMSGLAIERGAFSAPQWMRAIEMFEWIDVDQETQETVWSWSDL